MNRSTNPSGSVSRARLVPILLSAAFFFVPETTDASTCVDQHAAKTIACSADDVRVTHADNVRDIFGLPLTGCIQGKSFSFIADFRVRTTAHSRYDIGLYFATDGDPNRDGAISGACSANIIRDRHLDPTFPNAVMLGAAVAADLDGDACRDITSANGWRNIGGKSVTLRLDDVLCHDSDGDGHMNLPNCASWSRHASGDCRSAEHAAPSSPADCGCNIAFNLPIAVTPATEQVADTDSPETVSDLKNQPVILSETTTQPETHP